MSNPVDDLLKEANQLSLPGMGRGFGKAVLQKAPDAMALAGATGLVTAGAAGIGVAANKIYDAVTKRRDFRTMLENNPDLQDHLEQNPKQFNLMFSSLRRFRPEFTADPLVAGAYMRKMVDTPMTAGLISVEALERGKGMTSPVGDAFGRGAMEGAKAGLRDKG